MKGIQKMTTAYEKRKDSKWNNRCDYCGRETERVRVYGHDQCAFCGTNVEPCCDGDWSDALEDQVVPI